VWDVGIIISIFKIWEGQVTGNQEPHTGEHGENENGLFPKVYI
jgi:hypothetical protein